MARFDRNSWHYPSEISSSLKREKIYLNPPNGGVDLYRQVKDYVNFYNTERRHKSIGRVTPDQRFYQQIKNVS
ncbi:integrase core domain-containing protein [Parapedobacter indicus]|uniref:integrase core domain-containing protein n=1 Tax=Parapedobacter indicus TaxID=1477437 RepID=UPI000B834F09